MSAPVLEHLFGRDEELERLEAVVDAASEHGGTLLMRGPAGIGKSALLSQAAQFASRSGMRVLTTSGVQTEGHLPFAGLHQLLRPLLPESDSLPSPQRDAMRAAFGIASETSPNLFLIALASLNLLADAATAAPLALLVEDAHWLDRTTSEVLAFVGRRLESDPIVFIAAGREGYDCPLVNSGFDELKIGPIDDEAARQLLITVSPTVSESVLERLLREAGGNPLALRRGDRCSRIGRFWDGR